MSTLRIRCSPAAPAACTRPAWTRLLCSAHYLRWRRDGQPQINAFVGSTGAIRDGSRSARIGQFDLSSLGENARLEIGFVL
jgi:hypothetical protein